MNIKKNIKYEKSESSFSFEFGGEEGIDAKTFSQTIDNVVESLKYITTEKEPEAYVKLKIKSAGTGSFDVFLSAIVEYIPNILNQGVLMAATIVNIYLGILQIKKHLRGEKPKAVNYIRGKAEIINQDDKSLSKTESITRTYFENNRIDNLTVNLFSALDKDRERKDLIVRKEGKKELEIKKEEFPQMAKEIIEPVDTIKIRQEVVSTELLIRSLHLYGTAMWEFRFAGKRIEAKISDENWRDKVNKREVEFRTGDKIPVEMLIEYDLDKNDSPIEDSYRYEILKVIGDIIKPDEQIKFNN